MSQHALDDIVSALAVLDDPFEVADQHLARLIDLATPSLVERSERWRCGLVQFAQETDGKAGEVVDEIERVLDFVRDSRRQLTERRHFLSLNEIGLSRLQIVQGGLGRVARGPCLHLRLLSFAFEAVSLDQAVAQHAERFRHGGDLRRP